MTEASGVGEKRERREDWRGEGNRGKVGVAKV